VLGAVTFYHLAGKYTYEIAPYDSATADMIALAYDAIAANTFFGGELYFHPTSETIALEAKKLPKHVKVISTDELFAGIDYQPLNLAESYGFLRYVSPEELEQGDVSFRDIVVLAEVPNDISVVMGIITQAFQTPLSHVNVLSKNRGTPNMGLRDALTNEELKAHANKWVKLSVGAFEYTVTEVTKAEADAWWDEHKPTKVQVPRLDESVKDMRDAPAITAGGNDLKKLDIKAEVKAAIPAFGGKASHYSILTKIDGLPVPPAFGIPVYYYRQFMRDNGFDERVKNMLADKEFQDDPTVRNDELKKLRKEIEAGTMSEEFITTLDEKLAKSFPGVRMRFRSSTNAEDLEGFTGAGLYTSKSGDPKDPAKPLINAVREVWASVWNFRAFEERSYRSIDHDAVGMALLVHRSFPDELANGVALTNNPFDNSNIEPAFYVNVQRGEASVVQPDPGVKTDQFLHYFQQQGSPVVYIGRSSLPPVGTGVLTNAEINTLGKALELIQTSFYPAYGKGAGGTGWWAMDVEFKFDRGADGKSELVIKQARPFGNVVKQ
jgi:pyruvate,water dikinase